MKTQSFYFLQALWDVDVEKEKLLKIAKNSMVYDVRKNLRGVLDERTIWVSSEAKALRNKIIQLAEQIQTVKKPHDLVSINEEMSVLIGQVRALQILTMKSLNSAGGVQLSDLHILVRQLFPLALNKIMQQSTYQKYRYLVLGGNLNDGLDFPTNRDFKTWLNYYQQKLMPLFDTLDDQTLDSRWAYEHRTIELEPGFFIDQFVKVMPTREELKQPLGIPGVGTGENGVFRIYGRGRMTNLKPSDFGLGKGVTMKRKMKNPNDFSRKINPNSDPSVLLKQMHGETHYLVDPEHYFEYINKYILANTFYQRLQTGSCFYCGGAIYKGRCSRCGKPCLE